MDDILINILIIMLYKYQFFAKINFILYVNMRITLMINCDIKKYLIIMVLRITKCVKCIISYFIFYKINFIDIIYIMALSSLEITVGIFGAILIISVIAYAIGFFTKNANIELIGKISTFTTLCVIIILAFTFAGNFNWMMIFEFLTLFGK